MSEKYAAVIVPGGTNIEARMYPAIKMYNQGETSVIILVGREQGLMAKKYLESRGVPEFSAKNKRGYIALNNDWSNTTSQSVYVARYLLKKHGIHGDLCISTEFHHSRAKPEFEKFLPERNIDLETVKVIKNSKEQLLRWVQAGVSRATDLFLVGLPAAKTDRDAYVLYSRDYRIGKALNFMRRLESRLYLFLGSESEERLKGTLI